MEVNRRLFLAKCGMAFSVLPNMLTAEQAGNSCGFPVLDNRELAFWDSPPMGLRSFSIISMEKNNSGNVLRIAVYDRKNTKFLYFFSTDNGQTWQPYNDSIVSSYGNPNHYPSITNTTSNNARTLFWRNNGISEIIVSADKGKSWKPIDIPSDIKERIGNVYVASVSPHDDNRIYIYTRYKGDSIYQVDYRTKTVTKITDGIVYMIESRATPKIIIGTTQFIQEGMTYTEIVLSKDSGLTWNKAKEDIVPNYYYIGEKAASMTRQSSSDRFRPLVRPINQIESDPVDPDTFYVVTWTGVFVTNNFGESFRILPISHEYINSVDEIAVNPVDGRHIFVAVKRADLYHSDDRGCTWKKLKLPTV